MSFIESMEDPTESTFPLILPKQFSNQTINQPENPIISAIFPRFFPSKR